jgi:protein-disulfide isomerase-like protein with CxxC motif
MPEIEDSLRHHWEKVHTRSRQKYNNNVLEHSDFVYDTEPIDWE